MFDIFAHASSQNTADLRKVVIHSCSVRGLEFNVLSPTLGNLRMLSSITLIDADFSNEQYRVSSSFAQLTSLTELVIRNCKLSDAHCCELINAIKPITDLKTICLAQNLVGMRTCNAIAGKQCYCRQVSLLQAGIARQALPGNAIACISSQDQEI